MYLIISRPFDVFAVVAPVSGGTEPLGAKLAIKDAAHLDTVFGVVDV